MKLKIVSAAVLAAGAALPAVAQQENPVAVEAPAPTPEPAPVESQALAEPDPAELVRGLRYASMPLVAELERGAPADPIWVRGPKPGANRVAQIRLRPLEAVVVEADLGQGAGRPLVMSLALVGEPSSLTSTSSAAAHSGERFYCGLGVGEGYWGRILCLADADRDGRFESRAPGFGEAIADPRQLSVVGRSEPLPAPIAYRPARAEEVPVTPASYRNCLRGERPWLSVQMERSGGAMTPAAIRGTSAADLRSDPALLARVLDEVVVLRGPIGAVCDRAERVRAGEPLADGLAAGESAVRFQELVVAVGEAPRGQTTAAARVIGLRDPERLYRLVGSGVMPLSKDLTPRQHNLAVAQRFDRPVLMLAAEPAVNSGRHGEGDILFSADLRHGYMGVLTAESRTDALFRTRSVPAGTIVYGIPMASVRVTMMNGRVISESAPRPGLAGMRLVWCVPLESEEGWSATCVLQREGSYSIVRNRTPAFEVGNISYSVGTASTSGEIPVEERSVNFPQPLRYVIRLVNVEAMTFEIAHETMFGDRVVNSRTYQLPRAGFRPTEISFAGGAVALVPVEDGSVEVRPLRPFRVGANALDLRVEKPAEPKQAAPEPAAPLSQTIR
jgi:hypothetical protein